jgi:hypothetical protein
MGTESIRDMQKRAKGSGAPMHYTGMKNCGELVDSSDSEQETKSTVLKEPTKPSLTIGKLLEEASKGAPDLVTPGNNEAKLKKKDAYERAHAYPAAVPAGLPTLQDLLQVSNALRDGTAFRGDSYRPDNSYRPNNVYRREKPHPSCIATHAADASHIFFEKKPEVHDNYSVVAFCDHQGFYIDWHPSDPENRKGTWQASMQRIKNSGPWGQHEFCQPPSNVRENISIVARRIIRKFTDLEGAKFTGRHRRDGLEPRRPPPFSRVEREVQNMWNQMHRGRHNGIVEKKEALRTKLDAADGRQKMTVLQQRQAQLDGHRDQKAKGIDIDNEVVGGRRIKKAPKQIAEDKVAQARLRKEAGAKSKRLAEPEHRFRPTTMDERDARQA